MARIGAQSLQVNLPARPALPKALALTDPQRAPDPQAVLAALPPNTGLIWRAYDKTLSRKDIRNLERHARQRKITLLIAATPADARKLNGSNRHLAAHRLNRPYTDQLVTAAAHSFSEIIAAARAGVDAVLISPVFATASHRGAKPLGPVRFAALARAARTRNLAVYALGGLTNDIKIRRLKDSGHHGIAGIGLFTQR